MSNVDRPAEPWMVASMQRSVASDISCKEIPYEIAINTIQKWKVFENWTVWEMNHRPVNVDELRECIEQELGLI